MKILVCFSKMCNEVVWGGLGNKLLMLRRDKTRVVWYMIFLIRVFGNIMVSLTIGSQILNVFFFNVSFGIIVRKNYIPQIKHHILLCTSPAWSIITQVLWHAFMSNY